MRSGCYLTETMIDIKVAMQHCRGIEAYTVDNRQEPSGRARPSPTMIRLSRLNGARQLRANSMQARCTKSILRLTLNIRVKWTSPNVSRDQFVEENVPNLSASLTHRTMPHGTHRIKVKDFLSRGIDTR